MASQSHWSPPATIGVALATIGVGSQIYFGLYPTDPAHPVKLDFLFWSITIRVWPVVISLLGITGAAIALVCNGLKRASGSLSIQGQQEIASQENEINKLALELAASENALLKNDATSKALLQQRDVEILRLSSQIADLQTEVNSQKTSILHSEQKNLALKDERDKFEAERDRLLGRLTKPPKSYVNDDLSFSGGRLIVSSQDDFAVRIERHQDAGIKGLLITFLNNRSGAIVSHTITIHNAQSFDARLKQFRTGILRTAFVDKRSQRIEPSFTSGSMWLVRKDASRATLMAGNSSQHEMEWPPLDASAQQRWLISLRVEASIRPLNNNQDIGLAPIVAPLVFTWDKNLDEFTMEPLP